MKTISTLFSGGEGVGTAFVLPHIVNVWGLKNMNKSEFVKLTREFAEPTIIEFDPDNNGGLLSVCWVIEDTFPPYNKFCVPVVRLSHAEYLRGDVAKFHKREKKQREKYNRWFVIATNKGG